MEKHEICKLIIQKIKQYLSSPDCLEAHREKNHFIRKRKLSMLHLVTYLFYTTKASMYQNLSAIRDDLLPSNFPEVSKQAVSKARQFISPSLFQDLFTLSVDIFYKNLKKRKLWHGYHIFAIDGSKIEVPNSPSNFDFFGKTMSGRKEDYPLWKRATSQVESQMGEALGKMYAKKYFPESSKKMMVELIKNLQISLGQRIDAQTWMSDTTKANAHKKLDKFYVKVGYPNKWTDYSKLTINPNKSFYENVMACRKFAHDKHIADKAGKPVDRDEWGMTPQTVNAYYNPTTNEICFPAGILQYPFFDPKADEAFNYGAIGVVIGHEMTHGFDDQGRQ